MGEEVKDEIRRRLFLYRCAVREVFSFYFILGLVVRGGFLGFLFLFGFVGRRSRENGVGGFFVERRKGSKYFRLGM